MGSTPTFDAQGIGQRQGNENYQNAQQNVSFGNFNQVNPYGSQTWEQSGWQPTYNQQGQVTGYSPRYTSTIKYTPEQQNLLNLQQQAQTKMGQTALDQIGRLQKTYSKDMNATGLSPWQTYSQADAVRRDETPTDRAAVQAAMMRLYDEQANRQNAADQNQAIARGMMPGGQGYGSMVYDQGRQRTDAIDKAFLASGDESRAAQAAYNQAVQQKYQMGSDWANQMNNLHQQQLTERQILREQPLKEAMTMAGYAGPSTPTFQSFQGSQMNPVNYADLYTQKFNADSQAAANRTSGWANLAGSVAGAMPWASWLSDRRLKVNISRLPGRELAGVPLYAFTYRKHFVVPKALWNTRHVGVMADEVRAIHPDAVSRPKDGYDRVNYDLLHERNATWQKVAAA